MNSVESHQGGYQGPQLSINAAFISKILSKQDLIALIVAGYGSLHHYGAFQRLAGFCPWNRLAYAVATVDRLIVLVSSPVDAEDAAEARPDADVRLVARSHYGSELAQALPRTMLHGQTVGAAGLSGPFAADDMAYLVAAIPSLRLIDSAELFRCETAVKSAEELVELRSTAGIVEAGILAGKEYARAGLSFREIAAEIERVVRRAGATEILVMASIGPSFGRRPSSELVASGDLLTVYVEAAGVSGYWVEAATALAIEGIDGTRMRLLDACQGLLEDAKHALVPGADVGEMVTAASASTASLGVALTAEFIHGVGLGDQDYPRVETQGSSVLSNMVVAIHPQVQCAELSIGASVGNTYHVTSSGAVPLVDLPVGMNSATP